jgi:Glucose / Sorbosone dehydrogenase
MLRVDVDAGAPYAIPPGNERPWGMAGRPEIWAMGLRNPWRFAFDSAAGLIYIADVGHFYREEVDVVRTNRTGVNFGWNVMEGRACYWSFRGHDNLSRIYWKLPGIERLLLCRHRGLELRDYRWICLSGPPNPGSRRPLHLLRLLRAVGAKLQVLERNCGRETGAEDRRHRPGRVFRRGRVPRDVHRRRQGGLPADRAGGVITDP